MTSIKGDSKEEFERYKNSDYGKSVAHAKPAQREVEQEIDDALGLMPITLRLQKQLVEQLKEMAKKEGLGYQPYIRQLLTKHARENAREHAVL